MSWSEGLDGRSRRSLGKLQQGGRLKSSPAEWCVGVVWWLWGASACRAVGCGLEGAR